MSQTSTTAKIGFRLGVLSLVLLPLSALGTRFTPMPVRIGLLLFLLAALLGFAAICLGGLATRRQREPDSRRHLTYGAVMGLPAVLFFALNLFAGSDAPVIHDVTTAPDDPPQFVAALERRGPGDNRPEYNEAIAEQQRAAYPDLQSITTGLSPADALAKAQAVANELGWEIYAVDQQAGRIEAVDTTRWFGFKDDIVIRVRPIPIGSVVDLRSASRVGEGDLGTNARRIRKFMAAFTAATKSG